MLVVYPVVCFWQGAGFMFTPKSLIDSTPAYRAVGAILPFPAWGAMFLVLGVASGIALLSHNRDMYLVVLALLAGIFLVMMLCFVGAVFLAGATPMAPSLTFLAAASCFGSMESINSMERG